jgi:hypothetical protein
LCDPFTKHIACSATATDCSEKYGGGEATEILSTHVRWLLDGEGVSDVYAPESDVGLGDVANASRCGRANFVRARTDLAHLSRMLEPAAVKVPVNQRKKINKQSKNKNIEFLARLLQGVK